MRTKMKMKISTQYRIVLQDASSATSIRGGYDIINTINAIRQAPASEE